MAALMLSMLMACGEDYQEQGDKALEQGNFEKAIEYYHKGLSKYHGKNLGIMLAKIGNANYGLGRYLIAHQNYSTAIELVKDDPEIYYNRGTTSMALAQYSAAITDFKMSESLGYKSFPLFFNLATSSLFMGETVTAAHYYGEALNFDTTNYQALYWLSWSEFANGHYEESRKGFEKILSSDGTGERRSYLGPAISAYYAGDTEKAMEYFLNAINSDLEPNGGTGIDAQDKYFSLLWLHFMNQPVNADEIVHSNIDLYPAFTELLERLRSGAMASEEIEQHLDEGLKNFNNAEQCEVFFFLGKEALRQGIKELAIRLLRRTRQYGPDECYGFWAGGAELRALDAHRNS